MKKIRQRVHEAAPDAEEAIKWGAPAFIIGGRILLVMAAFKAHAALNFWRGEEIGGGRDSKAMGQFGRLASIDDLPPDDELDGLVRKSVGLAMTAPAPRKPRHEQPEPGLHPDFAAALEANPAAKDILESFPPSARREYAQWIAEAKQDQTRAKRIATAIDWLGEGKRRHWKYQGC